MGNWRRVQIIGTCDWREVPKLRQAIMMPRDYLRLHCLMNGGLAGLPLWAGQDINAIGNLAERDYTPQDVADTLVELVRIAPSLTVKVHCGADYEASQCIATVTLADGAATVGEAEIEEIPDIPEGQMKVSFLAQLLGG